MIKVLEDLILLQSVDDKLSDIQKKMGNLPEIVNGLKDEIKNEKKQIKEYNEESNENQTLTHKNDGIIVDSKAQLEKYQEQLYLVTTNREYDALTSEIDYAKNEIYKAEESILSSDELIETLEENTKISESNIKELGKNLKEAEKNLTATIEATKKSKGELDGNRTEIVKEIQKKFLTVYDRVRRARKGTAVVPMQREACSGCHNRIIPQKRVEIQKGNKIIFCDVCGRFLYFSMD
ncbi:MAG: hypothetical protein KAI81_02000 [Candidatus Marinimicrobia bacterium]|nr:hypothetical protein [Candidatus Neomarinimicrobiota bacterium]